MKKIVEIVLRREYLGYLPGAFVALVIPLVFTELWLAIVVALPITFIA